MINSLFSTLILSTLFLAGQAQSSNNVTNSSSNVTEPVIEESLSNNITGSFTEDENTTNALPPGMEAYFGGVDYEGYTEWHVENNITNRYTGSVWLPSSSGIPSEGAAIHWNVDELYVYLAVAVRATGWVGFGIAEAGGMLGSDMALFTASRPQEIIDAYTLDERNPMIDDCSQDWDLVASNVDDEHEFVMFEVRRMLNTGDKQDRHIINDSVTLVPPHRVIAAWGDSDEVSFHGKNRARGAIRFFSEGDEQQAFDQSMNKHADGTFEVRANEFPIKPIDTEYVSICISRDDLIAQGVPNTTDLLNVIGFEPIITEGSEPFVHHFIVGGSQVPTCNEDDFAHEVAYAWGPGEHAIAFPDELGVPLFGTDGFNAFHLEIHYDNRHLVDGIIDSSGVKFYFTNTPRQHQVGILQVGDPFVALEGQEIGDQLNLHEFICPGSCSKSTLIDQPVTVVREALHMHRQGVRMVNEQIRDDEIIRSGLIDVWEFDQSGAPSAMQGPFTIMPGDGFKTSCYYRDEHGSDSATNSSRFGLSSQDEMCIAFLYYYPRHTMDLEAWGIEDFAWMCGLGLNGTDCDASYEVRHLLDDSEIERQFGYASCNAIIDPVDVGPTPAPTTDNIMQTPQPTIGPDVETGTPTTRPVPASTLSPESGSVRASFSMIVGLTALSLLLLHLM